MRTNAGAGNSILMKGIDVLDLDPCRVIIGFIVSIFFGALVLWFVIEKILWPYITNNDKNMCKPKKSLSILLGICERASYTAAFLIGAHTWIGFWLAIKVAAQWPRWQSEDRATYNLFLIGNLLSIFFGLLGSWIALGNIPQLGVQ